MSLLIFFPNAVPAQKKHIIFGASILVCTQRGNTVAKAAHSDTFIRFMLKVRMCLVFAIVSTADFPKKLRILTRALNVECTDLYIVLATWRCLLQISSH